MTRVFLEADAVSVPPWVVDLPTFRRWIEEEEDLPEAGRVSFLNGEVWIDMTKEQLFSHNEVKSEINSILRTLVKKTRAGRHFADGAYLSNEDAEISNQPNGLFVSDEALRSGRVKVIEGKTDGHVELEGTPDMVLEVVSRSSVVKDTDVLRRAYALAGIREYWLVDARSTSPQFQILTLGANGYSPVPEESGWVRSEVFTTWFRLTRAVGRDGFPEFTLETRAENIA
ncbi:MAG: Uma2 family endonuclease [Gemmataceae bacterium]